MPKTSKHSASSPTSPRSIRTADILTKPLHRSRHLQTALDQIQNIHQTDPAALGIAGMRTLGNMGVMDPPSYLGAREITPSAFGDMILDALIRHQRALQGFLELVFSAQTGGSESPHPSDIVTVSLNYLVPHTAIYENPD